MERPNVIDSIWAADPAIEARAKSTMRHNQQNSINAGFDQWRDLFGGVDFGSKPIENLYAYRLVMEDESANNAAVIDRMNQIDSAGMELIQRIAGRVNPMPVDKVLERWGQRTIDTLLSSGLAISSTDKKGRDTIQDRFEWRASIRFEFLRRWSLWRLVIRYANMDEGTRRTVATHQPGSRFMSAFCVSCPDDACESCLAINAQQYALGEHPPVPNFDCTCPEGCHLMVMPILRSGRGMQFEDLLAAPNRAKFALPPDPLSSSPDNEFTTTL